MNLSEHSVAIPAVLKQIAFALLLLFTGFGHCAAADDRPASPTWQDAMAMIAADREAFLAVAGAGPLTASADTQDEGDPDLSSRDDADPALIDFAMYGVLIESNPGSLDNVDLYVSRAGLFLERGLHDRAIQDLLMALRLDMRSQAAWHALARAHEMKGELETAQAAYMEAVNLGAQTEVGIAAQWDREVLDLIGVDDRRETLAKLGMPDAFTLIMIAPTAESADIARREAWFYYRAAIRFEFVDGKLIDAGDIEHVDLETVEAIFPPHRPYQFAFDLDFESVADIIGEQDYALYELGDNPLQDGELVYTRQLALGFKNGGLFYVRSFPLFTDE